MKTRLNSVAYVLLAASALTAEAQFSINPLTGFGGTDGWLAPGEGNYGFLTTTNTERGLAFGNGHLYLVTRSGAGTGVRILDPSTGADQGSLNFGSGIISGGTFAVNMAGVAGDGAIYVGNLANPVSATAPFNVYRWANEAALPTLAYSSTSITAGRMGDSLAVFGKGTSTLIAAGESDNSGSGPRNGYAILGTADGSTFTGSLVTFSGTPPEAGDFRLGITFENASTVIGTQGGGTSTTIRETSFSGTTGTLLGSPALTLSGAQRLMAFAEVGGVPLLATESTSDATVRIWDMTVPNAPVLLGSHNNTSGTLTANSHGTGELAWGDISGDTAKLWALSSNQGIQAFAIKVPEPGVIALLGLGLVLALLRRGRRLS